MCIGCSLSLQLSAWRGTVNDVFVLRSTFVLSWFLEQHKQAWNLFCPPRKKKKKGRHSSLSVHNSAWWTRESEFDLCFAAPLCLFSEVFICSGKKGRHSSLIESSCRAAVNCEFTCSSRELCDIRYTHTVCQQINRSRCVSELQWDFRGDGMNRPGEQSRIHEHRVEWREWVKAILLQMLNRKQTSFSMLCMVSSQL